MTFKFPLTPISPLQPGVEMFQRSRPNSIVPIDADLARRLSVVQEIPSPTSLAAPRAAPRAASRQANKTRPLSEVTEIFDYDDDDDDEESYQEERFDDIEELDEGESEFEEDSEGSSGEYMYDPDMVRTSPNIVSTTVLIISIAGAAHKSVYSFDIR